MRVLKPPAPLDVPAGTPAVFLAGSIEMGTADDWQDRLAAALADQPVLILNPRRDAWDASWRQSIDEPRFRGQVEWELDGLDRADLIAMWFAPETRAPITLLELGLHARGGKLVVGCPDGYWRKGNIEVVCARHQVSLVGDWDGFVAGVRGRLLALAVVAGVALAGAGCGRGGREGGGGADGEGAPAGAGVAATCVRDVGQVDTYAAGERPGEPRRPVNTFSIVARDPATGDLGVAVQSHWFAVGALVIWAEPGVGAVATQSFAEPEYGRKGLEGMRAGGAAADVLAALVAADKGQAVRQVGIVDTSGRAAAHTGASCIAFAGHFIGDGYAVQANIMANDRVVPAMARAYETTSGDLADRLLAALDAAQAAGGDLRGCQSAAIRVVRGTASAQPSHDVKVDLRVDDAAAPLVELRRLLALSRVYDHMNAGDVAVEKGDVTAARDHYGAAAKAAPDRTEIRYWQAVGLASAGQVEESLPIFRAVFREDGRYVELTRRLQPGVIPATPVGDDLVKRIVAAAAP
jgi:uncharacterized Ntn-hydrolase superfamily protein